MSGGAHVTRRSPGTWQIRLETGRDENGARLRTTRTVKGTRREADRLLAEMVHQFETGTLIVANKLMFSDFAARWLRDYAKTNVSPTCYQRYASIIRLHLLPAFGHLLLEQIEPAHIVAAESHWLLEGRKGNGANRGLSAKSVVIHHILLSEMLSAAVKWGLALET